MSARFRASRPGEQPERWYEKDELGQIVPAEVYDVPSGFDMRKRGFKMQVARSFYTQSPPSVGPRGGSGASDAVERSHERNGYGESVVDLFWDWDTITREQEALEIGRRELAITTPEGWQAEFDRLSRQ